MKHSTKETRQQFVCVCVRVCVWGGELDKIWKRWGVSNIGGWGLHKIGQLVSKLGTLCPLYSLHEPVSKAQKC